MCELIVPETVYPPKEDSLLLCKAISRLEGEAGNALEIGCGSGALVQKYSDYVVDRVLEAHARMVTEQSVNETARREELFRDVLRRKNEQINI